MHICCVKLSYVHVWSISTHLTRLTANLFIGHMHCSKWERMLLYVIWEVVCTYSLSRSVLGLTSVIPPASPGDVLPWLLWWWRPILGIRVVACFATAVKRSMLSRSHGPHRQLQRVTWPLSLSAPRRAIERVVSPGWTVESWYCFEWKQRIWGVRVQISYSRSLGKAEQVIW